MKICISCKKEKSESEFYTSKKTTDGYRGTCKACAKIQAKERSLRPKVFVQKKTCFICGKTKDRSNFNRNSQNPDGLNGYCKPCHCAKTSEYVSKHRDEVILKKREYHKNKKNDPKYRAVRLKYNQIRNKREDVKLLKNLRRQLWGFIKNNQKSTLIMDIIGISRDEFMRYIESQFYGDMTWDTYGETWQIDHKKPCSSFDILKDSEMRKCFHYTNLQPLTSFDNASKGCRIIT